MEMDRNGCNSAKSAYMIQFKGTYCSFDSKAIWGAMAEGKHRIFSWLLVQRKEVWSRVAGLVEPPLPGVEIEEWWNKSQSGFTKNLKLAKASILIHTIWSIWKIGGFSKG
ncbi:hypothetical protein HU200_005166 [Digitaria exilis]|uniref:Reverse transcriptase zinc-binding domain-containing protein n=1 Tax=Digitaria exilis TaxID=1010633 RepID=A0A835FSF0_9POAL|nr:hypothetical protein HU200_005166 [Digitaria exilis]